MTDKVKQMAPLIWQEIKKSNNILIHCHRNPDADSVGSALATMLALKSIGKNVTVIAGDSEIPKNFSEIPGFNEIKLVNFSGLDLSTYDLFLALDIDRLDRISSKEVISFPDNLTVINIDHHGDNAGFAKITLSDISYPATAQMLFDLFSLWGIKISAEIAKCLMTGIYTDTGGFKYAPTSPETFVIGSQLAKIAPDFGKVIYTLENSNTPEFLRFLGLAIDFTTLHFEKIAISEISMETLQKNNIPVSDTRAEDISVLLRSVIGWDVSISMIEQEKDVVRLSMRTRDPEKYDLSLLARSLGGGGHKVAAGAMIKLPFGEAKELLLKKIRETFQFLNTSE